MLRTQSLFLYLFLQYFTICGQINATYGFINVATGTGTSDPGPWPMINGLDFKPFTAVGVSAQPSASGRFSYSGWPVGAIDGVDDELQFTGTLSGLSYYEVKVKLQSAYSFSITAIYFNVRRSSTGVRHFCVRTSADDFSNNLAASTGTNQQISVRPGNYFFWKYDSFSTSSDQKGCLVYPALNCVDSVIFRFYAWNAEAASGSFSIDNVTISGVVKNAAVPLAVGENDVENSPEILYDVHRNCFYLKDYKEAHWFFYATTGELIREEKQASFIQVDTGSFCLICCEWGGRMKCRRFYLGH